MSHGSDHLDAAAGTGAAVATGAAAESVGEPDGPTAAYCIGAAPGTGCVAGPRQQRTSQATHATTASGITTEHDEGVVVERADEVAGDQGVGGAQARRSRGSPGR